MGVFEHAMLPPSLHWNAMRVFQIGIISKKPQSFLSVQPYSNPPIKESLGMDWKLVILEQKASTDYSSSTITTTWHLGVRVGGDALASRRPGGLARPGRALGAPPACALAWLPGPSVGRPLWAFRVPARDGPGLVTRIVKCSPDKQMLFISSSHEKQTAIKTRASRNREFYINESQ